MNRVCQTAFRRRHNRPRRGLSRPPAELVVEPMAVIRKSGENGENRTICAIFPNALYTTPSGQNSCISSFNLLINIHLDFCDDFSNFIPKCLLSRYNLFNLGIQYLNIYFFSCIFLLHIRGN